MAGVEVGWEARFNATTSTSSTGSRQPQRQRPDGHERRHGKRTRVLEQKYRPIQPMAAR
jgi:hypothetical protein